MLLPSENGKDIDDVPDTVRDEIEMTTVSHLDEVLSLALKPRDGKVLFHAMPKDAPGIEDAIAEELSSSSQH